MPRLLETYWCRLCDVTGDTLVTELFLCVTTNIGLLLILQALHAALPFHYK